MRRSPAQVAVVVPSLLVLLAAMAMPTALRAQAAASAGAPPAAASGSGTNIGGTGGTGAAPADAQAKMKAEMDAYMKLAQPGEHHKLLGHLAGKWVVTGKTWMDPSQPPVEMTFTVEASWLLGGRYLQQVHTSTFMGQPFEGRSLDGYDNFTHEYFSTWVDNMGTGVMVFRGKCDDPCTALTESAEGPDPMTGKVMKSTTVTTFVDPDTYRFEMYEARAGKDGQGAKVMDVTAKRQK